MRRYRTHRAHLNLRTVFEQTGNINSEVSAPVIVMSGRVLATFAGARHAWRNIDNSVSRVVAAL